MPDPMLLSVIAENPLDDQLRWIAASQYEREEQSERARFIRTQLAIAQLPLGIDDPEWFALTRESRQLLRENEQRWLEADGLVPPESGRFRFDRGFVELVEMGVRDIVEEKLGQLVAQAPIQHVDVLPPRGDFDPAALPRGDFDPAVLFRSLEQQVGGRLVSLGLEGLDLGDDDIGLLTELRWPGLRWLSLAGNRLTGRGVGRIAASWTNRMPVLEYVDLLGNEFDPANQVEYDQDVVLRWRDEAVLAMEHDLELEPVPWLRPMIEFGHIRPIDRLEFGRPQHVPAAGDRG
jgi:hypothetical protein